MSLKSNSIENMHQDHREWQSQHSMWNDDIDLWQDQLKGAMQQANELTQLIGSQLEELANQRSTIDQQESVIREHEKKLADGEHFGNECPEWLTIKHRDIRQQMQDLNENHNRIKQQHRELVVKVGGLVAALGPGRTPDA